MNRKKWNLSNEICFKLLVILPNTAIKGVDDEIYLKAHCGFLLQQVGDERDCLTPAAREADFWVRGFACQFLSAAFTDVPGGSRVCPTIINSFLSSSSPPAHGSSPFLNSNFALYWTRKAIPNFPLPSRFLPPVVLFIFLFYKLILWK